MTSQMLSLNICLLILKLSLKIQVFKHMSNGHIKSAELHHKFTFMFAEK